LGSIDRPTEVVVVGHPSSKRSTMEREKKDVTLHTTEPRVRSTRRGWCAGGGMHTEHVYPLSRTEAARDLIYVADANAAFALFCLL
jgi:hypothetical protein